MPDKPEGGKPREWSNRRIAVAVVIGIILVAGTLAIYTLCVVPMAWKAAYVEVYGTQEQVHSVLTNCGYEANTTYTDTFFQTNVTFYLKEGRDVVAGVVVYNINDTRQYLRYYGARSEYDVLMQGLIDEGLTIVYDMNVW